MKTKTMTLIDGELAIGNFSLSKLAKVYKTPLYVYDEVQIRERLRTFKTYFNSSLFESEIIYASKAFLAPYMCSIVNEEACAIDTVSLGELDIVKRANFPLTKVYLHGNNKAREELIFALENEVGYIVVDNIDELHTLIALNSTIKKTTKILLRVNPGIEAHTHEYIKTAKMDSKFGESIYDDKTITEFINLVSQNEYLQFRGFHIHIGSNIHNEEAFLQAIDVIIAFIKKVALLTSYQTKELNLGGGFGIKYLESDQELNLASLLSLMVKKLENYLIKDKLALTKIMLEPGRSIVGDAGVTLYTVGATKQIYNGKKYLFVDGGMTDNIRPALYKAEYSVEIANRPNQEKNQIVDIVGKCCESGDIVAKNILVPEINKNDYLVVFSTGAYGYTMASNYNGALKSSVLFINHDKIKVAINRESLSDLSKTHVFSEQRFFDVHTDILYDVNQKVLINKPTHFNDFHVPQLAGSQIKGGLWTMYSPDDFDLIAACKRALEHIDINLLPGFEVILGLEGLRNLKQVEDLDILYQMGFRHAMLTWNEENKYATGAKANPEHGLHEEGIKLIKKMEALDMIIDLAHLNEKSFYDCLALANKNIINSHCNVKSLCNHPRNITDEQMQALRKKDGLMGLTLANNFVASKKEEQTLERFLDHVDYAVKIMDVDHVCFGFDFMDYLSEFPNSNLEEVESATQVYRISEGLKRRGYSSAEIDKMCYWNFYKRFKDKIVLRGRPK